MITSDSPANKFVFVFVSLALLCLASVVMMPSFTDEAAFFAASWAMLSQSLLMFVFWQRRSGSSFDPFVIFIISMTLFSGGHQILYISGLSGEVGGILNSIVPPDVVRAALFQVHLAWFFLSLGAIWGVQRIPAIEADVVTDSSLRKVGWALLLFAAVPAFLNFKSDAALVWSSGYAELFRKQDFGGFSSLVRVLAGFFLPGCILIIAGSKKTKAQARIALVLALTLAMPDLFLGERSRAIMPILALAWVWHKTITPLRTAPMVTIGLIFLFIVFPVVRVIRETEGAARTSVEVYWLALTGIDNPAIQILDEMGKAGLRISAWTYQLVPDQRPFDLGVSYLNALGALLPNFSGQEHFSSANRLSSWLAWNIRPEWAAQGGAFGFSYIGEAYLNFGWVGIVAISLTLGYALARVVSGGAVSQSQIRIGFLGCCSTILFFIPRAELQQVIRDLVWYSIIPIVLVSITTFFNAKKRRVGPISQHLS